MIPRERDCSSQKSAFALSSEYWLNVFFALLSRCSIRSFSVTFGSFSTANDAQCSGGRFFIATGFIMPSANRLSIKTRTSPSAKGTIS